MLQSAKDCNIVYYILGETDISVIGLCIVKMHVSIFEKNMEKIFFSKKSFPINFPKNLQIFFQKRTYTPGAVIKRQSKHGNTRIFAYGVYLIVAQFTLVTLVRSVVKLHKQERLKSPCVRYTEIRDSEKFRSEPSSAYFVYYGNERGLREYRITRIHQYFAKSTV